MSEVVVDYSINRVLSGQLTKRRIPPTLVSSVPTVKIAYDIEDVFADEGKLFTFPDEDIWQLERILNIARQNLEKLMASRSELEIPEVFDLQPLSRKRVTVKVRKRGPAPFYFITEDEE